MNKLEKKDKILVILCITSFTTVLILFFLPLSLKKISIEIETLINILLIGSIFFIRKEMYRIIKDYNYLVSYMKKLEKISEEFKIKEHEKRNQLIVIKCYVSKRNKDAHDYINLLLNISNNKNNRLLCNLKAIPFPDLKSYLHYKINEIQKKNISLELFISKELEIYENKIYTVEEKEKFYTIIGILINNAVEAAEKSSKREIDIKLNQEGTYLVFEILNSYSGEIDLNQIDNFGFSSKGENRGYGLYIINSIIQNNETFKIERSVNNNYFTAKMMFKIK